MMKEREMMAGGEGDRVDAKAPHRLSISLPAEHHRELAAIAHKNRVSLAWVVRTAVERLLKDEQPLLRVGHE